MLRHARWLPPVSALAAPVALALLAGAPSSRADSLPARAVHVADYDMRVRLDPEAKTLEGKERIVWHNPSPEPVGELWFHLYLNAFKSSKSTFFVESGGQLRGDRMAEDGWGWVDVRSIRRADGVDLLSGATFEHPDDANADDRTVWRVPLPEPVPAGGEIALDVNFQAKLPRIFARTGYFRDYFLVGQWFPKLGVYEPAGLRGRTAGGWNCHQFHANSEFYADFGRYRVEVTLPKRFVVGATGTRTERRENADGTSTHVFEQADVIDFAWTASPRFLEVKSTFSGEKDVTPQEYAETAKLLGRSPDDVRLSDVEVKVLLQPQHAAQAERHLKAAKAAIKWFGLWYGRYPYRTITVVDPAFGAGGSGGMEYPTFITAGTSSLFNHWPLDRVLAPEEVTVHEFGHQYWQSMVASNEFEESWLDEGFNTHSTAKVMERTYGPWVAQVLGLRIGESDISRAGNSVDRMFDAIRTPAWGYSPGNYGFNSYQRTDLTLQTLESLLGTGGDGPRDADLPRAPDRQAGGARQQRGPEGLLCAARVVVALHVGDLVAHHAGQLAQAGGLEDRPAVEVEVAGGQREGVQGRVRDHAEAVDEGLRLEGRDDALAEVVHEAEHDRVVDHRDLRLDRLVDLRAEGALVVLAHLRDRGEIEAAPAVASGARGRREQQRG